MAAKAYNKHRKPSSAVGEGRDDFQLRVLCYAEYLNSLYEQNLTECINTFCLM